jgi:hypothetical protein
MRSGDDLEDDLENVELPELGKALLSQFVSSQRSNWFVTSTTSPEAAVFGSLSSALPVTSGVILAADENTAIRIALEENGVDLPSSPSAVNGTSWDL